MRRDIEKSYSTKAFIAKLRRLADALERGERFATQVAGRRVVVPRAAIYGIEHEREGGVEEIEFQIIWKTARRRKARR
ncbi:MAG TPA: amphi-Trp domain-containing protein [Acidiferrobacterales bacterium]|nr:amphi-Trp domain-containing protein [Acidiferrobacterales bacterium]